MRNAKQNAGKQLVQLILLLQLIHKIRIQTNLQNNVKIKKMHKNNSLVQLIQSVQLLHKINIYS